MAVKDWEAVTFGNDAFKAVVKGVLQRPDFNSKGAANAFGKAVFEGKRKAEPVRNSPHAVNGYNDRCST